MAVYNISGVEIADKTEASATSLCFSREYQYVNPYLTCERKDLNTDGTLSDSTTRCVIHLPKHGTVEVRVQKLSCMFKVAKVSGTTVTWLDSDWSYYCTRYIGDGTSTFYCVVALSPGASGSTLSIDEALDRIAVYQFVDIGEKRAISTRLNGKTVAFIGDSITSGRFRKYSTSGLQWTATKPFGGLIAEYANDMNYGNFGIGGATISQDLTAWESLEVNCTKVTGYDVVFICGGTNDYGNNITSASFTSALDTVISTLKTNNGEVVACSPVYRTSKTGENSRGLTLLDYCNLIKSSAQSASIKYIDLYTLTNDGVFITFCPDGLHPNEIGHKIMADLIISEYDRLSA